MAGFEVSTEGVEFQGATVTSDAGLLLPRELDERLGLSDLTGSLFGQILGRIERLVWHPI